MKDVPKNVAADIKEADFPPSPIAASGLLEPIRTWVEMVREIEITKVEFDAFWFESVKDGVAYFFRWMGEPRSTILVVWNDDGPTHIECRKVGDLIASEAESRPMIAEITQMFRDAGFGRDKADN
jgi:hypothetical protein